jgi:hypothetical protein
VLVAALLGTALMTAISADAASCNAVTIAQGRGLSLDVSSVLITEGGCVRFANLTSVTVTVRVSGTSFSTRLPAKTPASASSAVSPAKSATVTATDGVRTGRGSITVQPKPEPVESDTSAPVQSYTPTPQPTKSHATPSATPSTTPSASSTPTPQQTHHNSPAVSLPGLPSLPPGSGSEVPPTASHPVVAPRVTGSKSVRTEATVLDPVSGPRRGLPASVAAVVLLGLAAAYGRTILAAAPAVDGRRSRRPSHP